MRTHSSSRFISKICPQIGTISLEKTIYFVYEIA